MWLTFVEMLALSLAVSAAIRAKIYVGLTINLVDAKGFQRPTMTQFLLRRVYLLVALLIVSSAIVTVCGVHFAWLMVASALLSGSAAIDVQH